MFKKLVLASALAVTTLVPAHANDDMKAKFAGVIAMSDRYVAHCGGKLSPKAKAAVRIMSKSVDMTT